MTLKRHGPTATIGLGAVNDCLTANGLNRHRNTPPRSLTPKNLKMENGLTFNRQDQGYPALRTLTIKSQAIATAISRRLTTVPVPCPIEWPPTVNHGHSRTYLNRT